MIAFFVFVVAASCLAGPALGQPETSGWGAFTSMSDMSDLMLHRGSVWVGSSGGLLRFDRDTQTYARYTRLNGLAGNRVLCLATDANGHVWVGTDQDGLSRFRPETGSFDLPFLDFKDRRVGALAVSGNRVFVGTDQGISAFLIDKEEVQETYRSLGLFARDSEITALAVHRDTLWAGTPDGIAWADLSLPNLLDPDSWRSTVAMNDANTLVVVADTLYAAAKHGVYFWDADDARFRLDLVEGDLTALGALGGQLVTASEDGAFYKRRGYDDWVTMGVPGIDHARSLSHADTALWIATGAGLKVVGAEPPPPPREPPANQFFEMAVGSQGELWIASVPNDHMQPRYGVYEFDGEDWASHHTKNGLPSNVAVTLESDAVGRVWIGLWGKGMAVLDTADTTGRSWHHLNQTNSPLRGIPAAASFVVVSDIARDADGLMWIANVQAGLLVVDGYPVTRSLLHDQSALSMFPGRDIGRLAIADDGLKYIGTPRDGFIFFDDGGTPFQAGDEFSVLISPAYDDRLTSTRVSDVLVDATGQVWVGTDNGLNAVRGSYSRSEQSFEVGLDDWRIYNTSNGLRSNTVSSLARDSRGNIWVGTDDGLTQIGPDGAVAVTLTTDNSGLIDNRVQSLRFDRRRGELWIGTLAGLSRLQITPGEGGDQAAPRIFPNPFLLGPGSAAVRFADLPLGALVRIFALDGRLVREIPGTPGQGAASWDGQNAAGFLVGSGIYLFLATNEAGATARGKFAVVNAW